MEAKQVKRGRSPNFSAYENSILLDLIDKHKSKIEKENCWKELLSVDFNCVPGMSIQNKTLYHIVSPQHFLCPVVYLLWLRDWIFKRGKMICKYMDTLRHQEDIHYLFLLSQNVLI